jgi:hypothetical protein
LLDALRSKVDFAPDPVNVLIELLECWPRDGQNELRSFGGAQQHPHSRRALHCLRRVSNGRTDNVKKGTRIDEDNRQPSRLDSLGRRDARDRQRLTATRHRT